MSNKLVIDIIKISKTVGNGGILIYRSTGKEVDGSDPENIKLPDYLNYDVSNIEVIGAES